MRPRRTDPGAVVAVVTRAAEVAPVLAVAGNVARVLGGTVDVLAAPGLTPAEAAGSVPAGTLAPERVSLLAGDTPRDLVTGVLALSEGPAAPGVRVRAAVLSTGAAGGVQGVLRLADRSPLPLVVLPGRGRTATQAGRAMSRVLVPLDGSAGAARAVSAVLEELATAGLDLVVLQVFDPTTVPRFWDQPAHAVQSWAGEFLARYCAHQGARLELRRGIAGQHVVDVAAREHVDLITMGWTGRMSTGCARTVRAALTRAPAPVLLVRSLPNHGDHVATERTFGHSGHAV